MLAGHLVAWSAFLGVAFTRPLLPVLYTCMHELYISMLAVDSAADLLKQQQSVTSLIVRLMTCEIPGSLRPHALVA